MKLKKLKKNYDNDMDDNFICCKFAYDNRVFHRLTQNKIIIPLLSFDVFIYTLVQNALLIRPIFYAN